MARKRSPSPMKAAIIKGASNLFFEIGYSKTTPKAVCEKADVGTGNLTYYRNNEAILQHRNRMTYSSPSI